MSQVIIFLSRFSIIKGDSHLGLRLLKSSSSVSVMHFLGYFLALVQQ